MKIPNHALTVIGIIVMLVGLFFDTSIENSRGDRIHNIGMMNDRLALIILGATLFIGGILLRAKTSPGDEISKSGPELNVKQLSGKDLAFRLGSIACAVLMTSHPLRNLLSSDILAYLLGAAAFGFLAFRKGDTSEVLRRFWLFVLIVEALAALWFAYSFLTGGNYVFRTIYSAADSFDVFGTFGAISIYVLAPFAVALGAYLTARKMK